MFGGILALRAMGEDVARRVNNLRIAYRGLEALNDQYPLLRLIKVRDDDKESPYPEICPVNFPYRFTPEFVERYREHQPVETANVLMGFAEALEQYAFDMEVEASRIRKSRE